MPISFQCPNCGASYNVDDSMAGKQAKCRCGNPMTVPGGAAPANPQGGYAPTNQPAPGNVANPNFQQAGPQTGGNPMAGQSFQQPQQPVAYQDPGVAMQQAMQQPMQQPMHSGMPGQPNAQMPMGPAMGPGYPMQRPSNAAAMMVLLAGIMAMVMALDQVYPRGDNLYDLFRLMSKIDFTMKLATSFLGQLGMFFAVIGIAVAGIGLLISGLSEFSGKSAGLAWARLTGMISAFVYVGIRTIFFLYGAYQIFSNDGRVSILFANFTSYLDNCMIPMFLIVLFFARRRG